MLWRVPSNRVVLSPKKFTDPSIGLLNKLPGSVVILSMTLFDTELIPVAGAGNVGNERPDGM
jgi:hypothetical protein